MQVQALAKHKRQGYSNTIYSTASSVVYSGCDVTEVCIP